MVFTWLTYLNLHIHIEKWWILLFPHDRQFKSLKPAIRATLVSIWCLQCNLFACMYRGNAPDEAINLQKGRLISTKSWISNLTPTTPTPNLWQSQLWSTCSRRSRSLLTSYTSRSGWMYSIYECMYSFYMYDVRQLLSYSSVILWTHVRIYVCMYVYVDEPNCEQHSHRNDRQDGLQRPVADFHSSLHQRHRKAITIRTGNTSHTGHVTHTYIQTYILTLENIHICKNTYIDT